MASLLAPTVTKASLELVPRLTDLSDVSLGTFMFVVRLALFAALVSTFATPFATARDLDSAHLTVCLDAPLLLRNATIIDATGEWDHQDIYVKNGKISAIGTELNVETTATLQIIDVAGGFVRPRAEQTLRIIVHTADRAANARGVSLIPGTAANMQVSITRNGVAASTALVLDIVDGRVVSQLQNCVAT